MHVGEPRLVEEALLAENELREEIFRTARALLLVLDPGGRIIEFNPYLEELTGYRLVDVRGRDWFSTFLPERDRDSARSVFREVRAARSPREHASPIRTTDGRELQIEWSSSPLTEGTGSARRILVVGHVVTGRDRAEQKLRELSGKLITAQEEERRHVSRELHDDLGQRIALMGMEIERITGAARKLSAGAAVAEIQEAVGDVTRLFGELAEHVRDLSHRLHPAIVAHLGLSVALRKECAAMSKGSRVLVSFRTGRDVTAKPARDVAICLYRVAQEAIRNAVNHSQSPEVEVSLSHAEGGLLLSVQDRGQGFDPRSPSSTGLGLVSMRERARLVGARLDIVSAPGRGTRVTCWAPAAAAEGRRTEQPS